MRNDQMVATAGQRDLETRLARRVDAARRAAEADRGEEQRLSELLAAVDDLNATRGAAHERIEVLSRALRELTRAMFTDPLTGLRNRRGFLRDGGKLLGLARLRHLHAAVFFFDVDRLKAVNDADGHAAGDAVLRGAALALRATFRRSDAIGRLSGDEFAAVALVRRPTDGSTILRRLDHVLCDTAAECGGMPVRLAAGVAVSRPDGTALLDELLEEADQVMYRNKRARPSSGEAAVAATLGTRQPVACQISE